MVDLQPLLGSALVSAAISAWVTWISGDRWVAKNQQKRDHSLELKKVMEQWHNEINDLCPKGVEINHFSYGFQGVEKKNLDALPYPDFFINHVITGYPDLLNQWSDYQSKVEEYNERKVRIYEEKQQHIESLCLIEKVDFHYHKRGTHSPWICVRPKLILDTMFQEIVNRANDMDAWYQGIPTIEPVGNQGKTAHRLSFMNQTLMTLEDREKVERFRDRIISMTDDDDFSGLIFELVEYEEYLDTEKENFKADLTTHIELITLGENIKGHCGVCRSWLQALNR